MARYIISLHGQALYSYKKEIKKNKIYSYDRNVFLGIKKRQYYDNFSELVLFDSILQAKLWLILYSSMPKASIYLPYLSENEKVLDKIINKGKYKSSLFFSEEFNIKTANPLLCEFLIQEC